MVVSAAPLTPGRVGRGQAWVGPIVMNTQEQLREACDELEKEAFLI